MFRKKNSNFSKVLYDQAHLIQILNPPYSYVTPCTPLTFFTFGAVEKLKKNVELGLFRREKHAKNPQLVNKYLLVLFFNHFLREIEILKAYFLYLFVYRPI